MKIITLLALFSALGGCATMSEQARVTEVAWQTLNAVDIGQTVTISREPTHWHETNPGLCAIATSHPDTGKVYSVMIGDAVLHYAVTRLLDNQDHGAGAWHVANMAWQSVTLGEKTYNVVHNFDVGLKPWAGRSDLYRSRQ
jgi:hypothetical protein